MKSYVLDLGGLEILIYNDRGYVLENGKIKDFFKSVLVLDRDSEKALKNNQILKIMDETEAYKIYFEDFWGRTKVRDLLLECYIKNYTVEETSEIIGRAYPMPIEMEIKSVKDFIKKETGTDWK